MKSVKRNNNSVADLNGSAVPTRAVPCLRLASTAATNAQDGTGGHDICTLTPVSLLRPDQASHRNARARSGVGGHGGREEYAARSYATT